MEPVHEALVLADFFPPPFPDFETAKERPMKNPMFQAAVRLAYWVATNIPYLLVQLAVG